MLRTCSVLIFIVLHFFLEQDPLTSKSHYIEQQLTDPSTKTVYLPSCITVETFSLVGCFCYNAEVVITPFNVVPLRVAAELLEMNDVNYVERNLRQITETYFCQAVAVNGEYAIVVLRQCLKLLPEAEETAFLASRCIEALVLTGCVDGVSNRLIEGVKSMTFEEFQVVAHSMKGRFTSNHDLLYRVVELYLKVKFHLYLSKIQSLHLWQKILYLVIGAHRCVYIYVGARITLIHCP